MRLLALLLLAGCAAGGAAAPRAPIVAVLCEWYVRGSQGEPPTPVAAGTLDGQQPDARLEADPFIITAHFTASAAPEGPALSVAVADGETGRELARTLYQFDESQAGPPSFVGGHGFTGLHYVYHPATGSELQYICALAEPGALP